jgi:excisionase family DNA binding protein
MQHGVIMIQHSQKNFESGDLQKLVDYTIDQASKKFEAVIEEKLNNARNDVDVFLSQNEVAQLLKVSRQTVLEWRKKGIIPSIPIEGKILFSKKEVIKALESNKREISRSGLFKKSD